MALGRKIMSTSDGSNVAVILTDYNKRLRTAVIVAGALMPAGPGHIADMVMELVSAAPLKGRNVASLQRGAFRIRVMCRGPCVRIDIWRKDTKVFRAEYAGCVITTRMAPADIWLLDLLRAFDLEKVLH